MYGVKRILKFEMNFLYIIEVFSIVVFGLIVKVVGLFFVNVFWELFFEEDNFGILVNYEVDYKIIGSENWFIE